MIRLTIELYQEPELPNQWVSKCVELDVLSGARTPERALEAVAEAVRMTVQYVAKRDDISTESAINNMMDRSRT